MGRAPYGARGLQFDFIEYLVTGLVSRPVWGAWIEIPFIRRMTRAKQSRPVWGAWIEISLGEVVPAILG